MNTDLFFDECRDCEFKDVSNQLSCCMINKLGLALHNMFAEIPIIKDCVADRRSCHMFIQKGR